LLAREGLTFIVSKPGVDKFLPGTQSARELAEANAALKARDVAAGFTENIVLGADTVVAIEDRVLGKPQDLAEGVEMLRALSGRWHEVVTGVALVLYDRCTVFSETTRVRFKSLSEDDILRYHQEVNVLDKAGGYAIQDGGDRIIEEVQGCRDNVMGLPVTRVLEKLQTFVQQ
jgi:septum formation protein